MSRSPLVALVLLAACTPEGRYQRLLDRVDSPGAQLAVVHPDGERWTGAAGTAGGPGDVRPDTAFLVGSNTKVMTTAIVLQLVDEGALSLDDAAATWVPALGPGISIRDLLQHTSGVGEYFDHDDLATDEARARSWIPDELVSLGLEVRNDGPQRTATYANTNFVAAGLIVESVEERPFGEVLRDRILEPLGMERSGFVDSGEVPPSHVAQGEGGEWGTVTIVDPSTGWAAGSAYASAADLARLYEAIALGELYDPGLLDQQLDFVEADLGFQEEGMETFYGLGMMAVDVRGQRYIGHLGSVEGFSCLGLMDPESTAVAVLTTNTSDTDFLTAPAKALGIASRQ